MVYGVSRGPPVDESDLAAFVGTLSSLPVEEWRKRIAALKELVDSIPDYSTTPKEENGESASDAPIKTPSPNGKKNKNTIPWYRSSKSVRRLANPLKSLLLDARSAVVKEATELVGTLMIVKLQPHPSLTTAEDGDKPKVESESTESTNGGGLETINGALDAPKRQLPPPPAFVGRLLLKDMLPTILDMSKQTVKTIRTYGVNLTLDILPHCRVKSCLIVLLERMKTHQNRTLREDCARYLRCVLETWPWDPTGSCDNISNDKIAIVNSRKEERLTLDSTRQIGLGLGRTLSDSAKSVREEAKHGFQVLFRRFRPLWDEVMSSGVVRDVRLRKKLLDTATRSDGNLFDDMASLGEMSLNSAVSGLSYSSYRSGISHRSRGMTPTSRVTNNGVPMVIGTPKTSPGMHSRRSPGGYLGGGGPAKIHGKESPNKYSVNQYVTSSGHVLSTPSPRNVKYSKPSSLYAREENRVKTPQQPFASLLQTPCQPKTRQTPDTKQKSCKILRRRLSRRISGIKEDDPEPPRTPGGRQLSSIIEADDINDAPHSAKKNAHSTETTNVALEVIAAHLSHLDQIETLISNEKELLLDLNKKLGISVTDETKTAELANRLASMSEEQVCDYFEAVHVCVHKQRYASEILLNEMERISQGEVSTPVDSDNEHAPELLERDDLAQSPLGHRNLRDEFVATN